jgi:hypothetical protein
VSFLEPTELRLFKILVEISWVVVNKERAPRNENGSGTHKQRFNSRLEEFFVFARLELATEDQEHIQLK